VNMRGRWIIIENLPFLKRQCKKKQCKRAQELFLFVPWTFLYLIFVPDLFQEDKKGSKKVSN